MSAKWKLRLGVGLAAGLLAGLALFNASDVSAFPPGGRQVDPNIGNCLSVPVIFSDGIPVPLRGTAGDELFEGAYLTINGTDWYLQQDLMNEWQADNVSLDPEGPTVMHVSDIDWGDNLEARSWTERDRVRVEVVLWSDLVNDYPAYLGMLGYDMLHLYGEGPDEMWGTNTNTYVSDMANVYSGYARLTIQRLDDDANLADLTWDGTQWTGPVNDPVYSSAVYEGGSEGPTSAYSAEINVGGKVIYGYNWNVRTTSEGPGVYRLTFSLDDLPGLNTFFTEGITEILVPVEEEEVAAEGGDTGGGVAMIDYDNNLTYIDVTIVPKVKGKGGGSGGNGGHGGGGGPKGPPN